MTIVIKKPASLINAIKKYHLVMIGFNLVEDKHSNTTGYADDANIWIALISGKSAKSGMATPRSYCNYRQAELKVKDLRKVASYLKVHPHLLSTEAKNMFHLLVAVAKSRVVARSRG